jgi:hypothetical protein
MPVQNCAVAVQSVFGRGRCGRSLGTVPRQRAQPKPKPQMPWRDKNTSWNVSGGTDKSRTHPPRPDSDRRPLSSWSAFIPPPLLPLPPLPLLSTTLSSPASVCLSSTLRFRLSAQSVVLKNCTLAQSGLPSTSVSRQLLLLLPWRSGSRSPRPRYN